MSSKGLVCPECGTNLHDVEQTLKSGSKIVRWRRCFNGHRFKTEESVVTAKGKHRREAVRARVTRLLKHHSVSETAQIVGVSKHTVYRIAKGERPVRKYK